MVPRRTRTEVTVSGGSIPAEAEVICFLASANRDERRFANPDIFDLFRDDLDPESAFNSAARHASFGMGRHFCLGAMMARIEVEIAVRRLLAPGGDIAFADGAPPPDQGLFLRGPAALSLRFAPERRN
jgi:pulcherriminic acid synthase